eukprot:scaffold64996_cov68-Attheya_sp.AAC.1
MHVPKEVRDVCYNKTQGARKALKISRQGSTATDGSIASESVTSLHAAVSNITRAAAAPTDRRQNQMNDHFPQGFQAADYKQLVAGDQNRKKVGNPAVKDQFSLVFDDSTEAGSVYRCVHCNAKTFTWKTFNLSKANAHLQACMHVPKEVRDVCYNKTQGARKAPKISRQGSAATAATDGSIASESVASLEVAASNITRATAAPTDRRQNLMDDHFPQGFRTADYKQLVADDQKRKKVGNPAVKDQFSIVFDDSTEAGSMYRCVHCNAKTFTWKTLNSSKANAHLQVCMHVPKEVKDVCYNMTQGARKPHRGITFDTSNFFSEMSPLQCDENKKMILILSQCTCHLSHI